MAYRRIGVGQAQPAVFVPDFGVYTAPGPIPAIGIYDPATGRYLGGDPINDWYCGTILGQTLSPTMCHIPSLDEIKAQQAAELAATSAPAAAQAAALSAGDLAVAAACAANPNDCAAEAAAASHPDLSALVGPNVAARLLGIQPDGSTSLFGSLGFWIVVGILGIATVKAL